MAEEDGIAHDLRARDGADLILGHATVVLGYEQTGVRPGVRPVETLAAGVRRPGHLGRLLRDDHVGDTQPVSHLGEQEAVVVLSL